MKNGDMQVTRIELAQIQVDERRRPLSEDKVEQLVKSIDTLGLLQPIMVRLIDGRPHLVAGLHRKEAEERRGEKSIPCIVLDTDDPLTIELAEIEENLVRKELSPAEHAVLTARREEIVRKLAEREKVPPSDDGLPSRQARRASGERAVRDPASVRDQAEKTGEKKDKVQRSRFRARKIGTRILQKLRRTSLDKGVELDALAKLPQAEMVDLAERAAAGECVSARTIFGNQISDEASLQITRREKALADFRSWRNAYSDVEALARLGQPMSVIEATLSAEAVLAEASPD